MTTFVLNFSGNVVNVAGQATVGYSSYWPHTFTTVDPDATELNVGDRISWTPNAGGVPTHGTYLGRNGNDMILVQQDYVSYMVQFSASQYSYGDLITLEELPFPVCFVKGTLLTTPNGPIAIEDLVAGDEVLGSTGWREVKWVGWRNYSPVDFFSREDKIRLAPVCIRAHAISENVPSSDLRVSPWHHLSVDGELVRAGDLINDITVVQELHVTEVAYYHVELDQFDVIMAHGIYSESWADGGNRNFFQNADITSLRPEDMKRRRAPRPGFDHLVLRKGKELAAIHHRVAQRANSIEFGQAKEKIAA